MSGGVPCCVIFHGDKSLSRVCWLLLILAEEHSLSTVTLAIAKKIMIIFSILTDSQGELMDQSSGTGLASLLELS